MKKTDLIKLLANIPEDAEIMVMHGDETLGYYHYNEPYIHEEVAIEYIAGASGEKVFEATISNYKPTHGKETKIWVIE